MLGLLISVVVSNSADTTSFLIFQPRSQNLKLKHLRIKNSIFCLLHSILFYFCHSPNSWIVAMWNGIVCEMDIYTYDKGQDAGWVYIAKSN